MTRKTFLWNFKEQSFTNKKAINKELFFKSFVRDFDKENKRLRLIDDGSAVFDIVTTKKAVKKRWSYFFKRKKYRQIKKNKQNLRRLSTKERRKRKIWLKKLKVLKKLKKKAWLEKKRKRIGAYITVEKQILKHKFWDKIRLNMPVISNPKNKTTVLKLRNCINRLAISKAFNKQENLPVRIVKPKKGGFVVRFSVIKGFLPKKQFRKAKNALIIELSEKNQKITKTIQKFKKKFFLLKEHFLLIKNDKAKTKSQTLIKIFKKRLANYKKNILILKNRKALFIRNFKKLDSLKKVKNNTIRLPLKLDFLNYKSPNKRARFVRKRWWYKRKKLKITKKGMLKKPVFFYKKTDLTKSIYKNRFFSHLAKNFKNYEFKQNKKKSKLFASTKRNYNS